MMHTPHWNSLPARSLALAASLGTLSLSPLAQSLAPEAPVIVVTPEQRAAVESGLAWLAGDQNLNGSVG